MTSGASSSSLECQQCGKGLVAAHALWCNSCDTTYCSNCQATHRLSRHESHGTQYHVYDQVRRQVQSVLTTEESLDLRRQMYYEDSLAKWIGITMPDAESERPNLWDFSRISDLLSEDHTLEVQYPSLVSFIGHTGSGKSTLIKSLIRLSEDGTPGPGMEPVPSSDAAAQRSTSSDVHLYIDPQTKRGRRPLLLADSEGLRGGPPDSGLEAFGNGDGGGNPRVNNLREIAWAVNEKADRSYIVGHLYPRFLYTFSDVICFVTCNPREIESDTIELLNWASLGYDKTLNQRTPPSLLIVINKDERLVDSGWDNVATATQLWLTRLDESVDPERNVTFAKFTELKKKWSLRGTTISSPSQLLLRYYSNVRVVCVPNISLKSQTYANIHSQYKTLHEEIRTLALITAEQKETAHLTLGTTTFQIYVQHALSHFAERHKRPFDLEEVSGYARPVPRRFKDHIVTVLLQMKESTGNDNESDLLVQMAPLVAAAVAASACQNGQESDIRTRFLRDFSSHCVEACDQFFEEHWRCEQILNNKRCRNVKAGHGKGHQYVYDPSEDTGIYISSGDFKHSYDVSQFTGLIVDHLEHMTTFDDEDRRKFLQQTGLKEWISKTHPNRTCLSCLTNIPEHLLPCKHVLCNSCVTMFGTNNRQSSHFANIHITSCPFGCASDGPEWPWSASTKPPSAGVRVLSLDGGGVRGVLEITVLQYLQGYVAAEIGIEVPIVEMFDLVVGTSTGGLLALGLAHCRWDIQDSMTKFIKIASTIFSPMPLVRTMGPKKMFRYLYNHIYRTGPVERMFKEIFSENELLFGSGPKTTPIKVGVTTVSDASGWYRPFLLTNYSRPSMHRQEWHVRPDTYKQEMKVWEAARATSAAPTFFKPYTHIPTGMVYKDGALKHNNPIRIADTERLSIWRSGNNSLDLLLSIGTGIGARRHTSKPAPDTHLRRSRIGIEILLEIATDAIKSTMDCESVYESFLRERSDDDSRNRYHRFNVLINDGKPIPAMDEHAAVQRLTALGKTYCERSEIQTQLKRTARVLVASCFYFEVTTWDRMNRHWVCRGFIHSRLRENALEVLLTRKVRFVVKAEGGEGEFETTTTTPVAAIANWPMRMDFTVSEAAKDRRICIDVVFPDDGAQFAVSGFPRTIARGE